MEEHDNLGYSTRSRLMREFHFFIDNELDESPRKSRHLHHASPKSTANIIQAEMAFIENPTSGNVISMPNYTNTDHFTKVQDVNFPSMGKLNNKVISRFLEEDSSEYFDEAGKPIFHLTPLHPKSASQFLLRNDLLHVQYVSPKLIELNSKFVNEFHNESVNLIDIELDKLQFKHHHLYSLEHVLAECLKESYAKYENRIATKVLQQIENELYSNRNARDKLINEITKLNKSKEEIYLDSTVSKYITNIEELREKLFDEWKKEEELITQIKILWKDIKKIRKESSSTKTFVMMEIVKEKLDEDKITEVMNKIYENEYKDEMHKIEYTFKNELHEYKIKKIETKSKGGKQNTSPKLKKPTMVVNTNRIRQSVENRLKIIGPKNPKISLKLRFEEDLVTTDSYDLSSYSCFFKIYLDESFVCETAPFNINNNFSAQLTDGFSVQILPENKVITIVLVENDAAISKSIIDINTVIENPIRLVTFNTKLHSDCNKFSVGSGNTLVDICKKLDVALQSTQFVKRKLYTKGELSLLMDFSDSSDGMKKKGPKYFVAILKSLDKLLNTDELNFCMLSEIIRKVCETEKEVSTLMSAHDRLKISLEGNRVCNNKHFEFYNTECFCDNRRFKLLHSRENGKNIDLKNSIIPIHSSQISTEQMSYINSEMGSLDLHYLPDQNSILVMEAIDVQRYLGAKYIKNLNTNIQKNLHDSMLEKSYEELVQDKYAGGRRMLFNSIKSHKMETTKFFKSQSASSSLRVTVLRAFSLPDRKTSEDSNTHQGREDKMFTIKQLRPFARVSYKDTTEQTSTAVGNNPSWNQILSLSIKSGIPSVINVNIYDETKEDLLENYEGSSYGNSIHYRLSHKWLGSLQIPLIAVQLCSKIQGALKINSPPLILGYQNLADQSINQTQPTYDPITPMQKDDAFITLSIEIKPQMNPSFNKGISYLSDMGEGYMFKHLTDFLMNYSKEFPNRIISLTYFTTSGSKKCVTQFLQSVPVPDLEILQRDIRVTSRRESAKSSSSRSGDGRKNGSDRGDSANTQRSSEIESTQNTFEMKTLTRDRDRLENIIHAYARYVSLIPTYESNQVYEVTLMGWELLKILHGSSLDHTILLTSYLLYLGVKCWIIGGMGLPRGYSSYVMIMYDTVSKRVHLTTDSGFRYGVFPATKKDTVIPFIFDAATGTKYDMRDSCSPLKTIHYAYNDENIWINLQVIDSCDSVRLDFSRSSDWHPVFNKNISLSKLPPASDQNLYPVSFEVQSLQQKIENKIKVKVQKWRLNRRTIWNRYCSSVLKESLPNWEYWSFNLNTAKPAASNRLKQLMSTYKIYGFPLNQPYTNMKRILSSIKSTAIFLNEDPAVEFGLAVEVFSYPGAVLSVWLYLATITRI